MIIPPLGGLSSVTSNLGLGQGAASQGAGLGQAEGLGQSEPPLGASAGTGPGGSFDNALTGAISSLEQTQQSADNASQALATGTVSDPESAVMTVQDAQLEMQLASQIRTKAAEAAQSIFQTQV